VEKTGGAQVFIQIDEAISDMWITFEGVIEGPCIKQDLVKHRQTRYQTRLLSTQDLSEGPMNVEDEFRFEDVLNSSRDSWNRDCLIPYNMNLNISSKLLHKSPIRN
jgi:hypothetical protein